MNADALTGIEFGDAGPDDLPPVRALLAAAGLPTADVDQHLPQFLVARAGAELVGVAGLELLGESGLLRSVCVAEAFRGRGIADALCERLLAAAGAAGLRRIYLLTTTAEAYFARRGWGKVDRQQAPPEIRGTAEFASLCPATAVFMLRSLGSG